MQKTLTADKILADAKTEAKRLLEKAEVASMRAAKALIDRRLASGEENT